MIRNVVRVFSNALPRAFCLNVWRLGGQGVCEARAGVHVHPDVSACVCESPAGSGESLERRLGIEGLLEAS